MRQSTFLLTLAFVTCGPLVLSSHGAEAHLELRLRQQVETESAAGRYHSVWKVQHWQAQETAVIVCDMWDLHHCLNATRRGAEMAPRMDAVLKTARDRGAIIIHAPSGCMNFYRDHPARQRALRTCRQASESGVTGSPPRRTELIPSTSQTAAKTMIPGNIENGPTN
jgi:hypothetical protein